MDGKDKSNSLTYDTNPRRLRFVQLSQNPNDLVGNGVEIGEVGLKANLGLVKGIGAGTPPVVGITVADLTDGGSNTVTANLLPPASLAGQMTSGVSHWLITFTDLTTMAVDIASSDFVALCNAQLAGSVASATLDLSAYADLTPHIGKTISTVQWSTSDTWANTNPLNLATSTFNLELDSSGLQSTPLLLQAGDSGSLGPTIGLVIGADNKLRLIFNLITSVAPVTTYVNIDAASILLECSPTDLAGYYVFADMGVAGLGRIGWTIDSVTAHFNNSYGAVGATSPSEVLVELYTDSWLTIGSAQPINEPAIGDTSSSVGQIIGENGFHIFMYVNMYPISSPGVYDPLLVSEAVEIKHRNLPAFHLKVSPNPSWDETQRMFRAYLLVSQGPVDGDFLWMTISMTYLTTAFDTSFGASAFTGMFMDVDASDVGQGLAANYQNGGIVLVAKDYTGPWNYARLLLVPQPEHTASLDGGLVECIFNAREL